MQVEHGYLDPSPYNEAGAGYFVCGMPGAQQFILVMVRLPSPLEKGVPSKCTLVVDKVCWHWSLVCGKGCQQVLSCLLFFPRGCSIERKVFGFRLPPSTCLSYLFPPPNRYCIITIVTHTGRDAHLSFK